MSETENVLTAKVWNLAHVMNNAGVGSGDYVEQVTYLLFLKLDAEREEDGLASLLPEDCRWARLYDLRTNKRFTLKERPLQDADMAEFVNLAKLSDRAQRQETERFKRFSYAELAAREKLDLNLSWLREEGATDPASLPPPAEIAASIAEDLETALARFHSVAARLG
jgi:hypothetical protein